MRQPDDMDDYPGYVPCKCEVCGWIDDFTDESLNKEDSVVGFCDDCDEERIFTLIK